MIDLAFPPRIARMNVPPDPDPAITTFWFARTSTLFDLISKRHSGIHSDSIDLEFRCDLNSEWSAQIPLMSPCQVLVIELEPYPPESSQLRKELDSVSFRIQSALQSGKYPTIVCIGDGIPNNTIVHWINRGVFSYAESSSDPSHIDGLIQEANCFARGTLSQYLRFQKLSQLWTSLNADELPVLEMIFEGLPNKTIATRLKVSQRTVETRRHRIFEKFESKSLPVVVQKVCELKELKRRFAS